MNRQAGAFILAIVCLLGGCSQDSEQDSEQAARNAVRERLAADNARLEAMMPEERAAEVQRKAEAKAEKKKLREEETNLRDEKARLAAIAERPGAARGACLIVLKESLNDPYSAKLESTSSWYAVERKDGTILVQPFGRAKNAFGAYIQGVWNCVVKFEGDNVRVLSLDQIRP